MSALILANPLRRPAEAPATTDGAPLAFHRRLPGYAPTPLVSAPELAAELGLGQLYVKVESSRLGLPAFKLLGASWASYRLLVDRLGGEPEWRFLDDLRAALGPLGPLTLTTATDGNHGRAVAHMARLLGYAARIFVPEGTVAARIDAIESEGATVTVIDGTYDDAVAASARLADDRVLVVSDTSWDGYTDVPQWVIDGYSTILAEIDEQLIERVDVAVAQMGVGGLAAAVAAHYAHSARVVVVEPTTAACGLRSAEAGHPVEVPGPHHSIMAGLNCGNVSIVAWPAVASGVDVFVAVDDRSAEDAMRDLAGIGVVAGESGAAGLAGLRALAQQPAPATIDLAGQTALVICTEGATDPVAYERIVGRAP